VSQVDRAAVSGINGVPWDAVEFPSQFLEFWCYEKEVINLISGHIETGLPLPDALYDKINAAKNFHSGLQMLRQLEFALFDFRIHLEYDPSIKNFIQKTLDDVRASIAVFKVPVFNRFQHSFSHIFSGGYAAGYYSYKWAEVLSADAFSKFVDEGIFNEKTGAEFLTILESGGVKHPMDLYVTFRGRKPTVDALLKYSGL
jgi:oligopeptidase A